MKKIKEIFLLFADDLLYGAGTCCLTAAAWRLSAAAGLGILGALLLTYSILISRRR